MGMDRDPRRGAASVREPGAAPREQIRGAAFLSGMAGGAECRLTKEATECR